MNPESTMKKSTRKPARRAPKRRLSNPAAPRGLATIDRALKKIEREVGEYAGSKDAQKAMEALILVVPLKSNIAEWKKDIKEALIRDRGEGDRKYVLEAVKSGKPGVYVRAIHLVDYWQFEADLCLIHGGKFGGTEHTGQVVVVDKGQVSIAKAEAIDNNMEQFPVKKAADAIIAAYAFGDTKRGANEPYYESPSARRRY